MAPTAFGTTVSNDDASDDGIMDDAGTETDVSVSSIEPVVDSEETRSI